LNIALTYNIKREAGETTTAEPGFSGNPNQSAEILSDDRKKYLNKNIIENYSERIDDTYAEWDSMETITAVKDALESGGHRVTLIEADENSYIKLKELKPDFVFNIAEGYYGSSRESQIPAILEMLNIPFTGSDSITTGICHDKSRCKEILKYYGIATPDFFITDNKFQISELNPKIKFPKFIKPLHEGSSKGIYNSSVVYNTEELNNEIQRIKKLYNQPSIVEDYLPGKEFTAAVLGNNGSARVLPLIEIDLSFVPEDFNKIYSYEVKWFFDTRENQLDIFKCPAEIDSALYSEIENLCLNTYNKLRIKDWARIDIRLDENDTPYIIEINPLPGILPDPRDNSCYPKAARTAGMDYNQMINAVLNEAVKRAMLNYKC